jgi:Zn-dependent protease with chaperone function/uncharacterized tellurite resistance protein B-like protein
MFKAAISFLIIPIAGAITSIYLLGIVRAEVDIDLIYFCSLSFSELSREFSDPNVLIGFCNDYIKPYSLLQNASIISFITSIAILALFRLSSSYCGTDRDKNAFIFPKLIPFTILVIAVQVLVQGLILAYLSYLIPAELLGVYLPVITFLIGGGAAIGFFQVVISLSSFFKKPQQIQKAIVADKKNHKKLWDHVESIASNIDAKKPDNIILGLEPTFYATSANVKSPFGTFDLKGETLFLSIPLMKLFNEEELNAVIGHELGHFKAKDTNYTIKFAPVYANIGKSIDNLANTSSGATALAKLPAILVLSAMYEAFSTNIASISRDREFEADKVGCEASSKEGLVYSLAKVVTYSQLWHETLFENVNRLNKGRISTNLSNIFRESSLYNIGKRDINEIIEEVLPSIVQHPTDSHPPLADRYKNIDFDVNEITKEKIISQGDSVSNLVDDIDKIEEELTREEHQYQIAIGIAVVPEKAQHDDLADAIYLLAAAMIGADGKLEKDEVRVAEEIGISILPEFDRVEFRIFIDSLKDIPDLDELAKTYKNLDANNKTIIYSYLEAIANADNDFDDSEKLMLEKVKKIWSI